MRDFAAHPSSIYEFTFPWEEVHPTNFQMSFENLLSVDDAIVIGVQFDGNIPANVRVQPHNALFFDYQPVNSLIEVINSYGEIFWQDNVNDKVWVKLRGGRWGFWTNNEDEDTPDSDELLYEPTLLKIF